MTANRLLLAAILAGAIAAPTTALAEDKVVATSLKLPVEDEMPSLGGAAGWFNSPPLTTAGLHGKVVLVDFWTYTCINWLRTLPYVRAWAEKYKNQGLVVIGVHTPEFAFEHDVDNVRRAVKDIAAHGVDVDDQGIGAVTEQRLYQLIRQQPPIVDRRFEIEFLDSGAQAFAFTFG